MSAVARVAVVAEEPLPRTREALRALGVEPQALDDATPNGELDRLANDAIVLWLPHWALLEDAHVREIGAWMARAAGDATSERRAGSAGGTHVLCGRLMIDVGEAQFPWAAAVLASSPGGVSVRGVTPRARPGAIRAELPTAVPIHPPRTLSLHLVEVNRQTSVAARLCDLAGERPGVARLAVEPLWRLASALWRTRGPRRTALSRAALEAYRGTLTVAKLWERRMVRSRVAP
jgi:hypothetical protein